MTRVVVTRAEGRAAPLANALRAAGFDVVCCPLIEIEPIEDGPVDVGGYDWVIVTSANGAAELARRGVGKPARVAAIGEATARALRAHGLSVDFVPRQATQEGLVAEFPRPVGRVLFVGAEGARGLIVSELGVNRPAVAGRSAVDVRCRVEIDRDRCRRRLPFADGADNMAVLDGGTVVGHSCDGRCRARGQ